MIRQTTFTLRPREKGCHLVTDEILARLPELPETGLLHLFIRHTSAGLTLNENADPDVRHDADRLFDRLAPEREPYYRHTDEGDDDMPAHFKSTRFLQIGSPRPVPCLNESSLMKRLKISSCRSASMPMPVSST